MNVKGYLYILMFAVVNSLEFLLIKSSGLDVYLTGLILFGLSFILFFLVYLFNKDAHHYSRKSIKKTVIIGLVGLAINICMINGLYYTSATNAIVLGKTDVLFSLLLTLFIMKEKIVKLTYVYIITILMGIFLILKIQPDELSSMNKGDLLIILSAALLAYNAFRIKRALQDTHYLFIALVNNLINTLGFLIIFLFTDHDKIHSMRSLIFILGAGICVFLFVSGYYQALKILPLWKVRTLALLTPLFTVIGDVLYLDAHLSLWQGIGITLLLLGAGGIVTAGYKNDIIENRQG